ncbi:repressor LexA [Patescibacteria group bacterium]|nr:repressor LexA [Patescibacteria group bacterium]
MLTQKQQLVLNAIQSYINENDQPPTLSELSELLGIKTKRGVVKHLDALEKKGYLYRTSKPRGIILTNGSGSISDTFSVPILGYANAGAPLVFAEEDIIGSIKIDRDLIKDSKNTFALIVKGDSMNLREVNKVPILDRNYVVIEKNTNINDGDVVLAVVDNAATIKTFKRSQNSVILYPESNNPIHSPIYLKDDVAGFINGKVIAVLENPVY